MPCFGVFTGLYYIKNYSEGSLKCYLRKCRVHLIFDRYPPDSTKSVTRSNRAGKNASRKHLLRLHTPLPAQKIDLSVTHNRIQLISLISQYLVEHSLEYDNELVLTSEDPNPVAMKNGEVTKRVDLHNTHEEADLIIVNQLMNVAENGASNIIMCSMR